MKQKTTIWNLAAAAAILCASLPSIPANDQIDYKNDFEDAKAGSVPKDFLVLDGNFAVSEENGNQLLQLPGSPLDSFGFLFGPAVRENVVATGRFYGEATGRRFPTFALGLNGLGGYKIRVSPGKRELELYKGDDVRTAIPMKWKPGTWTILKLQVVAKSESEWEISGKMWQEGESEPSEPSITYTETESLSNGRAIVSASPYSGKPIKFDDLRVSSVGK